MVDLHESANHQPHEPTSPILFALSLASGLLQPRGGISVRHALVSRLSLQALFDVKSASHREHAVIYTHYILLDSSGAKEQHPRTTD